MAIVGNTRCTKCGADNREGAKFCSECATPFAVKCPRCGATNKPAAKFCDECAASLAPASTIPETVQPVRVVAEQAEASALDGERKTVTALFADIKGSTELMADLDPEEARAIIDPALKLMIEAVRRYDGYVVQSTGDGIFALFGAPVAHEDHPQRALYAALRLQEELKRCLAASHATGAELLLPYFLCLLAEACRETGRLDDGLSALRQALAARINRKTAAMRLRFIASKASCC
jgi:hypothetical protein